MLSLKRILVMKCTAIASNLFLDKNLISVEADNFFDELGLSDVSVGKGANALRESATSLRSNASRQSQTVVKKKN